MAAAIASNAAALLVTAQQDQPVLLAPKVRVHRGLQVRLDRLVRRAPRVLVLAQPAPLGLLVLAVPRGVQLVLLALRVRRVRLALTV